MVDMNVDKGNAAPEAKAPDVAVAPEVKEEGSLLNSETPKAPEVKEPEADAKAEVKEEAKADVEKDEVPEAYEFKLPEGQELDANMIEAFKPLAKEFNLGQKAAQKLVDMVASHAGKAVEAQKKLEAETIAGFKKSIHDDPKHVEIISDAKLAVSKFGMDNAEFKQLTEGWIGSHPGFVRFLANIGSHLREADMIPGSTAGTSGGKGSLGSLLYPDMNKKKS